MNRSKFTKGADHANALKSEACDAGKQMSCPAHSEMRALSGGEGIKREAAGCQRSVENEAAVRQYVQDQEKENKRREYPEMVAL